MRLFQASWGPIMGFALVIQALATPSVNVGMKAAFPAGPYLLELLETAAGENSSAYFPLLDRIANGHFSSAISEADLYAQFLDVLRDDGHVSSPEALSTFNLALSLRSAAPRVEAHYQYYLTAVEPAVAEKSVTDCSIWVLLEGKQYCTPSLDSAMKEIFFSSQVRHLPFDRSIGIGRDAVLYADPTSASFGDFHAALSKAAKLGALRYRLRYRRNDGTPSEPLPVNGYGVELALKKTDYIVIDDREADSTISYQSFSTHGVLQDEEELRDLKPLSTSDLSSLGMKTASFIMQNDHPFETLIKLTQDSPKFSTSFATHNVSENFIIELEQNRAHGVPSGINFLWLNGVQLIERQIEPFSLIEMLRRERKLINSIRGLGLNGQQAISLLGHKRIAEAKGADEPLRYDWTDRSENGRVIVWLNDLENDERYQGYPKGLYSLLQRSYPGQIPQIGKNIFHIVAPIDFSKGEDMALAVQLKNLVDRGIPIRFGLVPLTSTPEAEAQAKIVYHLFESYGIESLVTYIRGYEAKPQAIANENLYINAIDGVTLLPEAEMMVFDEVFNKESYVQQMNLAKQWSRRLKADASDRPIFLDGLVVPRNEDWMQVISMRINEDLQTVQKAVFHEEIDENLWVPGIFLEKALSRRNIYIALDNEKTPRMLDLNKYFTEHADLFGRIPILDSHSASTKENWAVLNIIADMDTKDGRELLLAALEFKRNNPGVRIDFIHNPTSSINVEQLNLKLKANEKNLHDVETLDQLQSLLEQHDITTGEDGYTVALNRFLDASQISPGAQFVVLNGRIIGPITSDEPFIDQDFQQLLDFERASRIRPVYSAMKDLGMADKLSSPLVAAKLTSSTALSIISDLPEGIFESAPTVRTNLYESWDSKYTAIEIGNPETASIHIVGLLNPASEQGQRWAPILKVLSELEGVYMRLFMNPKEKLDELPVKRFFRYVLNSRPLFDENGKVRPVEASFRGLPSEILLTAAMDVPPAWLVAPKTSAHDLDNIKLSSIKSDIHVMYELEHILIEGHSREDDSSPPRGAQLVLATERDSFLTDTIIMSNLGFFQFKANPGLYNIQLKGGRSAEIYEIESIGAQGWAPTPGDNGSDLALMDFQGTTLYPRLKRRPSMENEDVLQEAEVSNDGIVSKGIKFAEGLFGRGAKTKTVSAKEHAEINIFSVASGHLYERMLNIMMVSVMRHTKNSVKFWFIEQFLSPSFKELIPLLAQEYGFKYEMVTYKWPHWLRQQKEKQRQIWGYKILFLDVLFPLSLDKVIFVDADQIVRTDMMELVKYDLEGAPYGFTPMCDSRTEMEGFRFWKQGYWANYLRGRPYHISALYVVDLRRFRELAAGDRLRQQYHSLSADPNSLANLDQDLPNHMQFQIPIHSLPQEWLWCETWCSDDSLGQARTIDLCNNPQTKEPKLDRARRQVPEWTVYDDEIAALHRRWRDQLASVYVDGAQASSEEHRGVNTKSRKLEEEVHTKDEL